MADTLETKPRRRRGLLSAFVLLTLLASMLTPLATAQARELAQPDGKFVPDNSRQVLQDDVEVLGQEGKWTLFRHHYARVYGDGGPNANGFVAIVGGSIVDVCTGNPPPLKDSKFRQHWDGTWEVRSLPGQRIQTYIYKTDLAVFPFFDESCGGHFEEGKPFPEPFVVGNLKLRDRSWAVVGGDIIHEQGPGMYKNSVSGIAYDKAGNKYRVRALAEFEGTSEPGPPDFSRHFIKVRKIGK